MAERGDTRRPDDEHPPGENAGPDEVARTDDETEANEDAGAERDAGSSQEAAKGENAGPGEGDRAGKAGEGAEREEETSPEEEKRSRRKRWMVAIVAGIAVLAGIGYGIYYWLHWSKFEWTDDAYIHAHITYISPRVSGHVLNVYVTDNQPVKAGALLVELDPRDFQAAANQARSALDGAKAREQAARLQVVITQTTATANLDETEAGVEAALAEQGRAEAALAVARSQLIQAVAAVVASQAAVAQARADADAAAASARLAQTNLIRYAELVRTGAVSRQDYDTAVETAQSANALLVAAQKKVLATEAQQAQAEAARKVSEDAVQEAQAAVTSAQAAVKEAQARRLAASVASEQIDHARREADSATEEVRQLQAALDEAMLRLSYTRIYAPEDGDVTSKSVEPGEYVQPSQPLMAVVPEYAWVVANFKETQLDLMRPGQPVTIRVDAFPGHTFRGHVDSIQSGSGAVFSLLPPENATGNYVKVVQRIPVKIVFDEKPPRGVKLVPGMSVEPSVLVK